MSDEDVEYIINPQKPLEEGGMGDVLEQHFTELLGVGYLVTSNENFDNFVLNHVALNQNYRTGMQPTYELLDMQSLSGSTNTNSTNPVLGLEPIEYKGTATLTRPDTIAEPIPPNFFLFDKFQHEKLFDFFYAKGSNVFLVTGKDYIGFDIHVPPSFSYPDSGNGFFIYRVDLTDRVDNIPYVGDLGLQSTVEDVNYTLDLRPLAWDFEENYLWDRAGIEPYQVQTTDLVFYEVNPSRLRGDVIVEGTTLTFVPHPYTDGLNSFEYAVWDGVNNPVMREYDIQIRAVANGPDRFNLHVSQPDKINQIKLDIESSLFDTDGSETLRLFFSELPQDVKLFYQGQDVTNFYANIDNQLFNDGYFGGFLAGSNDEIFWNEFVLEVPKYQDTLFELEIIAQSQERGTDGVVPLVEFAQNSLTQDIHFTYSQNVASGATQNNNSLWEENTQAFTFSDNRFLGISEGISGTAGGFFEYDIDFTGGFQSNLFITSGNVISSIGYEMLFENFYNRTTDTLDTEVTNNNAFMQENSAYITNGAQISYELDFIAELNAFMKASVDVELGPVGSLVSDFATIFEQNISQSYNVGIIDTTGSFDLNLLDYLNINFQQPIINTQSQLGNEFSYSSNGDVDALSVELNAIKAATALLQTAGFIPGVGSGPIPNGLFDFNLNPFFFDVGVDVGLFEGSLEVGLIEFFPVITLNYEQNFSFDISDIDVLLDYGNNVSSQIALDFDNPHGVSRLDSASLFSSSQDGMIDYQSFIEFANTFENQTSIDFSLGYQLNLLYIRANVGASVSIGEISYSSSVVNFDDQIFSQGGSTSIFDVDIFNTQFQLNHETGVMEFIAT